MEKPRIIVGVPGAWPTRSDIVKDIAARSGGYLLAGTVLTDAATQDSFQLEVYDRDPHMRRAFEVAGGGRYTAAELDAIDRHTHTLYLTGEGGSTDAAWKVMRAARGLLRAGGLGVKVESAGLAPRPELWSKWTDSNFLPNLYHAFVARVGGKTGWFSCGMHHLGCRDIVIGGADASPDEAGELIHRFQLYELLSSPALAAGQTFSLDATAPVFRITAEECQTYPPGDLFHNPYGMWRLTRVVK
ncbi:hypothetical protein J0H58_13445 [bacterium]|nr:hypothetical protein [bacterium]